MAVTFDPPAAAWPAFAALALTIIVSAGFAVKGLTRRLAREPVGEREQRYEQVATLTVAAAAAVLSGQSLWRFAGDVLAWEGPLRILPFVALDAAVVTLAGIARRRVRDDDPAGLPGALMWGLAGFSGLLGAFEARTVAEAVARGAFPLIAAVLWHFGSLEQQRQRQNRPDRRVGMVRWLYPAERVRVAAELAKDRTLSERDATAAVRADRAAWNLYRMHVADGPGWRYRRAHRSAQRAALRVRLDDPEAARRVLPRLRVLAELPEIANGAAVASVTATALAAERTDARARTAPERESSPSAGTDGTRTVSKARTDSSASRRGAGDAEQVERVRALAAEHGGTLSVRQVRNTLGVRAEKAQRLMDAAGVDRAASRTSAQTKSASRTATDADGQAAEPEPSTMDRFSPPDLTAFTGPKLSRSALVGPDGQPVSADGRARG